MFQMTLGLLNSGFGHRHKILSFLFEGEIGSRSWKLKYILINIARLLRKLIQLKYPSMTGIMGFSQDISKMHGGSVC